MLRYICIHVCEVCIILGETYCACMYVYKSANRISLSAHIGKQHGHD